MMQRRGILKRVEGAGQHIVIKIEGDGESARKALEMVREKLHETAEHAKHDASEMAEAMARVKDSLETIGLYMGIREAIDGIKELIGGSLELGETLEKTSRKTGLSVESLSVLHYAAGVTGTSFESLSSAISKMDNTIAKAADGDAKAVAFMGALGLNAKELTERTDGAEVAFHAFVQKLSQTENPIERTRLAMGMLGKAGAEQIPMLLEVGENWDFFKKKAEEAGVYLDSKTAGQLADTNKRLEDMKQHAVGVGLAITEGMAPGLTEMFGIISSGKAPMETMRDIGRTVAQVLADVSMAAYFTGSGLEAMFGTLEGGRFTEAGRKDLAESEALLEKAKKFRDFAESGYKTAGDGEKPFIPHGDGHEGHGFTGAPVAGKGDRSANQIVEAAAALAQEQAKAASEVRKSADQVQLAELEAQHKMMLMSDHDFFQEKLRLQVDELDAEAVALVARQKTLDALYAKQHGDKTAKRDKDGHSAAELKTQKELVQLQEQTAALQARRAQLESAHTATVAGAGMAAELEALRAAAALERERNDGIAAQIALIQREHELKAEKVLREGGSDTDAANIRGDGQVLIQKLQIEEVQRRIVDVEKDHKRALDQVNDAVTKGDISKREGARETKAINAEEAARLTDLVGKYTELAELLGGEFKQKALDLLAELQNLGRRDHRDDFSKQIIDSMGQMATSMAEKAAEGKESFRQMTEDILHDAERLAIKLAEQKFLQPFLEGAFNGGGGAAGGGGFWAKLFGAGAEHHMSGGLSSGGPQVVGEAGPEIWTPPTNGGTVTPAATVKRLAEGGAGGSRVPNITQNIINQSSQPVTAAPPRVSYDSQLREFVVHTILSDHMEGGPISQASR